VARRFLIALAACLAAGLIGAAARSSPQAGAEVERRIDALIAGMTLDEKFGQLSQVSGNSQRALAADQLELVRRGMLGSVLNVLGAKTVNQVQRVAVEQSRLRIPLITGYDVVHGYRTIFPVPLAEAASWDPETVERSAAVAAAEARAAGVHWTFAPMVDIARDPRWGRIAEGAGEDPYLGMAMARARVRGFQGDDFSRPDRVVACAKHFVAYGAAEGGRDYNTTDMSERVLRSVYLPPFRAAVDAGAATLMSAFNDLNGVPTSGNPFTLTEVLRNEWGFGGFVVSDWSSVPEMVNHGRAADDADAARIALLAGVDMEMASRSFAERGPALVKAGRLPMATLDQAVRRVLRVKFRAGLFDRPYTDEALEAKTLLSAANRAAARAVAGRSMVLLKNEGRLLPLSSSIARIAVIGPLADAPADMLGSWSGQGRPEEVVTLVAGLRAALPSARIAHVPGCRVEGEIQPPDFSSAVAAAQAADAVVLAIGEAGNMSGEGASRSTLDLPGHQLALAKAVVQAGKPVVVVLFNGRPLSVPWVADHVPAIVEAWLPGSEAGNAVADVILGRVNPGGKLPATFPRATGQVPIYYSYKNTGRPPSDKDKFTSKYIDLASTPQFPFGHGLSYTTFQLTNLVVGSGRIGPAGQVTVSVDVQNVGKREGDEVLQLYVSDPVASVTRPVQELKGFRRITLAPGERRTVGFVLTPAELGFYDAAMKWVVEPGAFRVRVGTSSVGGLQGSFEVVADLTSPTPSR
jgi:beta-glucosidase